MKGINKEPEFVSVDEYCEEFIDKMYIEKLNEETSSRDIQIKWNFE